jgi:hypothetical protein
MFVPLVHPAGEAQADFGEALAVIGGGECKAHYLAMDLPHSDDCFVSAFPAETTGAFLEGHVRTFAYFGGVPTRILYNTKTAVAKILGGNRSGSVRGRSPSSRATIFSPTSSGDRRRATTRARRKAWRAMRGGTSWCRFRASPPGRPSTHLEAGCVKHRERCLKAHAEIVGERFECDRAALLSCRLRPMKPARRSRPGTARWLWCAIAATTTQCRPGMDIMLSRSSRASTEEMTAVAPLLTEWRGPRTE